MRKYWFAAVLLIAVVACTTDDVEPELVIPTSGLFEVLTATPHPEATSTPEPTATPVPTATPIPTPTPTSVPTATPVPIEARPFPRHIDPDFVTERPADEEIFSGWTEYLMDSEIRLAGAARGEHFCADDTIWFPNQIGNHEWSPFDWDIKHDPVTDLGEWQFLLHRSYHLSRIDGKTVRARGSGWQDVIVGDSWKCAESLVWNEIETPPLTTRAGADIHHLANGRAVLRDGTNLWYYDRSNWTVHSTPNGDGFWRLYYTPEIGLIGFENGNMWLIDDSGNRPWIREGPSMNSAETIYWLIPAADGGIYVGHGPDAEFDEIYSPETQSWTKVEPKRRTEDNVQIMQVDPNLVRSDFSPFGSPTIRLGDDHFLAHDVISNEMWIYSLGENTLTEITKASEVRRRGHTLQLSDQQFLLYFGTTPDGFVTSKPATTYEVYDATTDSWSEWEASAGIADGWFMQESIRVGDAGKIVGQFGREQGIEIERRLGLWDPKIGTWAWFDYPPEYSGNTMIPLSHNRLMFLATVGVSAPEINTWVTKLP